MDFFGGDHHRHHHRRDGDDGDGDDRHRREGPFHHHPPPPPDQFYDAPPPGAGDYSPPPFPPSGGYGAPPDPYRSHHEQPPPPAPYSTVQHVGHESHSFPRPHSYSPPRDDFPGSGRRRYSLPNGEDVRVFCEAETNYSLTIRDGSVVLAPANPNDEFQHWIKDETCSTEVKDEEGYPCFALVNKATGETLKHAVGATKPVLLAPYKPDEFDPSILWSMSKDFGHGFRTIRMVNNIHLNLDAFKGDKHSGGVHDGTQIVLWEWKKGENQKWKIVPYWPLVVAGCLIVFAGERVWRRQGQSL